MHNSPKQSNPTPGVPNKLSISLDFSSTSTSANTSGNQRSPIASPKSALTFAAVWDPEDGMVTFSGTRLLDSSDEDESSSGAVTPPDVSDDDFSQAVTADHDGYTSEENTSATCQDSFKAFLHRVPRNSKHKRSNTVASSTLDGYSRAPVVRPSRRYPSLDKLDAELSCKANTSLESDHVSDEGFFENTPLVAKHTELKSHWSVTTTSTSAYVDVPRVEKKADESRIPHPLWIADKYQPTFNLATPTPPNSPRRRLKKRRPGDCPTPVSPISCSSSSGPTSPVSASPSSTPTSPSRSLKSRKSRRLTRESTDDSWVSIEITPFITQRVVEEM